MFDRFIKLIGKDKFEILQEKMVTIVGVGGVGSSSLESIVRSGINNITIIDFDTIDITNLNRQLITTYSNIGNAKVEEAKNRALSINPNANITIINKKISESNIDIIIDTDYIIDAVDDIDAKISIIKYALKNNIKLICSMGTAKKMHPEKLEITRLSKTSYDPLARIIRKRLKDERINEDIMVVSSTEETIKNEVLGSNSFVPPVAGFLMASYVINDIIDNI